MMDDYVISERPSRPTYQDIVRGLADEYSQPRKPRLGGGHGESVPLPLPSVSGGSGDPPLPPPPTAVNPEPEYDGGLMVPVEYVLAEGGIANGAAITHHAIQRDPDGARAVGLIARPVVTTADVVASIRRVRAENEAIDAVIGRAPVRPTRPAPVRQPVPRTPYIGTPQPSDAATSLVIVIAFALLVAGLLWGAAGMPY